MICSELIDLFNKVGGVLVCNYNTNVKVNWNIHIITDKHNRNGKKKPISCDKCDYISSSHWNLKLHISSQHSTIDDRKNSKFYCETCDQIFFCKLYMNKHLDGIKHKNTNSNKNINE